MQHEARSCIYRRGSGRGGYLLWMAASAVVSVTTEVSAGHFHCFSVFPFQCIPLCDHINPHIGEVYLLNAPPQKKKILCHDDGNDKDDEDDVDDGDDDNDVKTKKTQKKQKYTPWQLLPLQQLLLL